MRKFLLSALLIGSTLLAANAQGLTFVYEGEELPNNATIEVKGWEWLGGIEETMPVIKPEVYLKSEVNSTVTIEANSNEEVQICIGDLCQSNTQFNIADLAFEAGVERSVELDYFLFTMGSDISFPSITVNIKAYDQNDPAISASVTIKMGGDLAGVEGITADGNNISVDGGKLNYVVDSASELTLYSLSGKTLVNRTVVGDGSIDLTSYPSGVYLYRLTGKNKKAGKFIIK